jgi:hypothetical protein
MLNNFASVILPSNAMKPAQLHPFPVKLLVIIVSVILIIGIVMPIGTAKAASNVYGLPFPIPDDQAHITDGIMAWGIFIVAIIFTGVIVGSRGTRKRPPIRPKRK